MSEVQSTLDSFSSVYEVKEKAVCSGVTFKCHKSLWHDERGVNVSIRFRILKRSSCEGCEQCDWQLEALNESIEFWFEGGTLFGLTLAQIRDEALYRLEVKRIDDKDFDMVLVERKQEQ